MIVGRFLGTLFAVCLTLLLADLITDRSLGWLFIIPFIALTGTALGLATSHYLGIMTKIEQPLPQDTLDYWVNRYGETIGRESYRIWLEEVDKQEE